jgi:hypothetical protein
VWNDDSAGALSSASFVTPLKIFLPAHSIAASRSPALARLVSVSRRGRTDGLSDSGDLLLAEATQDSEHLDAFLVREGLEERYGGFHVRSPANPIIPHLPRCGMMIAQVHYPPQASSRHR